MNQHTATFGINSNLSTSAASANDFQPISDKGNLTDPSLVSISKANDELGRHVL